MATYRDTINKAFLDLLETAWEAYDLDSGVCDINIEPDASWGPEALAYAKKLVDKLRHCIMEALENDPSFANICIECDFSPERGITTTPWYLELTWYEDECSEDGSVDNDTVYKHPFESISELFKGELSK